MEQQLDGNAASGMLQELFPFDMTTVEVTCTACGTTGMIGVLTAYMHGMGTVLRCPTCAQVLIRMVNAKGQYWLDMRGVRVLHITKLAE